MDSGGARQFRIAEASVDGFRQLLIYRLGSRRSGGYVQVDPGECECAFFRLREHGRSVAAPATQISIVLFPTSGVSGIDLGGRTISAGATVEHRISEKLNATVCHQYFHEELSKYCDCLQCRSQFEQGTQWNHLSIQPPTRTITMPEELEEQESSQPDFDRYVDIGRRRHM